ncbi:MAG: dihydropteroate synthase [Actinobacteria bacterium]|nr:dihydropteroate synthase [Actinomycetota bacterium]
MIAAGVPIEERFSRPSVMGIVNVTPDSFSDGGANLDPDDAVSTARRMLEEGAAIVDVGGESTRPGATAVSLGEELRRVIPALEGLAGLPVSIDTSKADVARRALELGAELVNDVTALRGDPALADVVAESGAYLCLVHMRGTPRTMQTDPRYEDVVSEVAAFLEERLRFAVSAGVREERICLDPGIGFGKSVRHNLELLHRLGELATLGRPLLVGLSRKSVLGRVAGDPGARTGTAAASLGAAVSAFERGAWILRVHDVRGHVEALEVARAVAAAAAGPRSSFAPGSRGVTLELRGLEIPGRHGVEEHELEREQPFLYDLWLQVSDAALSDRIEDAVDYRAVAERVRAVSAGHQYSLLEALAAAVADAVAAEFPVERVRVRVRKPRARPAGLTLEYSAATVERAPGDWERGSRPHALVRSVQTDHGQSPRS